MSDVVLTLDISSVSTGWAVFSSDQLVDHGKITFTSKQKHSSRLVDFEVALKELYAKWSPTLFAVEDVFVGRSPKVHKILSLYHGVAYKVCNEQLGDDPLVLYESEVRNIISDKRGVVLRKKGEKAKRLTFDYINKAFNLGFTFDSHNDITDAIAVNLAINILLGDKDEESLRGFRGCARSKPKRGKSRVQKTGKKVSSRRKSKRSKS